MRCKIWIVTVVGLFGALAIGQDINRTSEWHIKRAEQPQAKVEKEMARNGAYPVKGVAPAITNEMGEPIARKAKAHSAISEDSTSDNESVGKSSEPATKEQFSAAEEAVVSQVKDEPKPLLAGGICLAIAAAFVIGLRLMTRKIKIPDGALERV